MALMGEFRSSFLKMIKGVTGKMLLKPVYPSFKFFIFNEKKKKLFKGRKLLVLGEAYSRQPESTLAGS